MRSRAILTLLIPLACAALFVRLGVWQLSRLKEKRAFNTVLAGRLASPPAEVTTLPVDTGLGHYRRVSATGMMLYDREVVYAGRSHEGSPGVDLLTPMKIAGHDTVVMVNRGWAYSPDAAQIVNARWKERDTTSVAGFAETFAGTERTVTGRRVHALDRAAIQTLVGLPIAPYVLVQTSDSSKHADSIPVRLTVPTLDEGPHQSYAMQWFGFALVAVIGGVALSRRNH
ncbi:MAG TPA: SURF1 family protein [Gemmatimonadaceae bacterium]|jgi:surfeit locus 1 family protein|nr:SURF1 family protein [Gemmatimonadaceae bacterium]